VDVSVVSALTTLLLSLGTALTGTETDKATNTTYHNMPHQCREITGQTKQAPKAKHYRQSLKSPTFTHTE
jgi:hypothetical protein